MKELNVFFYRTINDKFILGKIAELQNKIYFEYDPSFLANPLWLSPYKLPPEPGLHEHKETNFGPVFGLFDDSIPDGWGLFLMDRFLKKQGIAVDRLSVLDRLAFLGKSTMGALTYEPAVKHEKNDACISLQFLAEQSSQIIEDRGFDILPLLMRTGGSPGGARPKVLVGVNKDRIISGEDDLPEGYEHWIVKFNSKKNFQDAGLVEYAYSLMAKDAGITMPETQLFKTDSGDIFFGTKRFDRKKNQRFHVHTFGNLIHSNFRIPQCNYETFLKVVIDLTKNHQDLIRGYRQMVFNIMANNRDDHVKNFAFMIDKNQEWTLTPAYDLIYAEGPGGEHSMDLLGEGTSPGGKEVRRLGEKSGLSKKEINNSVEQVLTAVKKWSEYAQTAGVTEQTMNYVKKRINRNLSFF